MSGSGERIPAEVTLNVFQGAVIAGSACRCDKTTSDAVLPDQVPGATNQLVAVTGCEFRDGHEKECIGQAAHHLES